MNFIPEQTMVLFLITDKKVEAKSKLKSSSGGKHPMGLLR